MTHASPPSPIRRSRQDAIEALRIAAQGKVKCQIEIRDLSELNQYVSPLNAFLIMLHEIMLTT